MLQQIITTFKNSGINTQDVNGRRLDLDISNLEGAWLNKESQSHIYIKIINNKIIAP